MKHLARILSILMIVVLLTACGGTEGGSETTEQKNPSVTTSDPETTEGGMENDETTAEEPDATVGGNTETTEPSEGETNEEVTTEENDNSNEAVEALLTVKSGDRTASLRTAYYWEGDFGDAIGGLTYLPVFADTLAMLPFSESVELVTSENGEVVHVRVFNGAFEENDNASGEDATGLSTLAGGIWYVLVGVATEEEGVACGYEFAFALAVDLPVYVDDGNKIAIPEKQLAATETFDAESGEWTIEVSNKSIEELVAGAPLVDASEYLKIVFVETYSASSIIIYDGEYAQANVSVTDLSNLQTVLTGGNWYVVVRVTYDGEYVEAEDRYETESYDYVFCVYVSEG